MGYSSLAPFVNASLIHKKRPFGRFFILTDYFNQQPEQLVCPKQTSSALPVSFIGLTLITLRCIPAFALQLALQLFPALSELLNKVFFILLLSYPLHFIYQLVIRSTKPVGKLFGFILPPAQLS